MHNSQLNLSKKILNWYDNSKRSLPWRTCKKSKKNQYYRLTSEIMLQQTQVKTVIPYFNKFVKKIPNLKKLSLSKESKVLKLWEGLGYYRRAKNLHKTSKILVKKYNSRLPKNYNEIIKLPGIGEYTAKALLSLLYNHQHIAIDGNVKRLFSRLFFLNWKNKNYKRKFEKIKNKYFKTDRNADLTEALIEFGAMICKPKNPLCKICNLKNYCYFYKNGGVRLKKEKIKKREEMYVIYCYLNKYKKEIALTNNNKFSFLKNFKIPLTEKKNSKNAFKKNNWKFLCSYKNNISNIKMNIFLFYKFVIKKPKNFEWHSAKQKNNEFIPTFTKRIIKKIEPLYL